MYLIQKILALSLQEIKPTFLLKLMMSLSNGHIKIQVYLTVFFMLCIKSIHCHLIFIIHENLKYHTIYLLLMLMLYIIKLNYFLIKIFKKLNPKIFSQVAIILFFLFQILLFNEFFLID